MNVFHRLLFAAVGLALMVPRVAAQDLSVYRKVHFGMNIAAVSAQTGAEPSNVTVVQQRPAVIRELVWTSNQASRASRLEDDSVQDVVFTFYDDQLFRIVATYNRTNISGLTDNDLREILSSRYGVATVPPAAVTSARLSQSYRGNADQVVGRWEDAQYSVNLVRSSYTSATSLVMFDKQLDAMARAAVSEAARLEAVEAPAREAARQEQRNAEARAAEEKARLANKSTFRP
jgi:hypothetical protein